MKITRFTSLATSVMLLLLAGSAQAQIAWTNLSLYYRADNVDGAGNPGTAATTTLVNLCGAVNPNTLLSYDGTIANNGAGVITNTGSAGTPFAYGVAMNSTPAPNPSYIQVNNGYFIQSPSGTSKATNATWEFWLRLTNSPSDYASLYGEYRSSLNNQYRHQIFIQPSAGIANYDEYIPNGGAAYSLAGYYTNDTFAQLVITKSGDLVSYYVDGTLYSTATSSESFTGSSIARTLFGWDPYQTTSRAMDGQFNIIRVYDRALSDDEVALNYNTTIQNIGTFNSTLTLTASPASPYYVGTNIVYTATVLSNGVAAAANATGSVIFSSNSVPVFTNSTFASGVLTYTNSFGPPGFYTISAAYSGDHNYGVSSNSLAYAASYDGSPATTTALASSSPTSLLGSSVIFTATIETNSTVATGADGSVTFYDGATALFTTSAIAGGVATYTDSTLGAGPHSLTAIYSGSAYYLGSSSGPVMQTVQTPTTVDLTPSFNPVALYDSVTFTATVTSNGIMTATAAIGSVEFKDGGTLLGTSSVLGGVAQFATSALPDGTHSITAEYSGDGYYLPSVNSPALAQVVSTKVIAQTSLALYYRADNVDGAGTPGTAATTTLVNLAKPGSYNGTIVNGFGVTNNAGWTGTPFAYGVPLKSVPPAANAIQTYVDANNFHVNGPTNISGVVVATNKVTAATWEFWLRVDTNASDQGFLYGEYPGGSFSSHYMKIYPSTGVISYDEYNPSGGGYDSSSGCFTAGVFSQLVVTKNNDTVRVYKNGVLSGTGTESEAYTSGNPTTTRFGMRYGSSNVGTDGEFNLIRVYNTVLSDAQVAQNYAVTVPPSLNYSQSGDELTISWPTPYLNWTLQQQTNGLNVGLGANWVDMAGTESVTTTNVPLNAAPAVFYRLRQP
jgi:hypothetical protein